MRKLILAFVLCLGCALPGSGRAAVITFAGLSDANCCTLTPYSEAGFTVEPFVGLWSEAEGNGNPSPSIFATFSEQLASRTVVVTRDGGGLFAFSSAQFQAVRTTFAARYLVEGQRGGFNQFAGIAGDLTGGAWTTALGDGSTLVDRLFVTVLGTVDGNFVAGTDGVFVDSIDVAVIAEPVSMALLASGLVGFAVARRRKAG